MEPKILRLVYVKTFVTVWLELWYSELSKNIFSEFAAGKLSPPGVLRYVCNMSHIYQKYPEKMSQLTLLTYFCLNCELKKFDNIVQNWEGDYKDYQRSTLPQVLKKKKLKF